MFRKLKINHGVRQGCILSPILFNTYGEEIINKALEKDYCNLVQCHMIHRFIGIWSGWIGITAPQSVNMLCYNRVVSILQLGKCFATIKSTIKALLYIQLFHSKIITFLISKCSYQGELWGSVGCDAPSKDRRTSN